MLDDILQRLNDATLLRSLHVVELIPYGHDAFRAKFRAEVAGGLTFQIWLNHNARHTRYAYQLLRGSQPILRWDNAPHHPEQKTNFPHHFHDADGRLTHSLLTGDPVVDLAIVLLEIEHYVQQLRESPPPEQ